MSSEPCFGLLGPLTVRVDGREADLDSGRRRALLACLLLADGAVRTPADLLAAGWAEDVPPSGTATLRPHLTRLRTLLEPTGAQLQWRSVGYALRVDDDEVDARRFERLLAAGHGADSEAAISCWREALALWRGPALGEFAERDFAAAAAARLEEARRSAVEALAAAELEAGHPGAALTLVDDHLVANPLREQAWATRMRALYQLGRQADALAAYRALRARLGEDLGIEPSPELRDLEILILRQDLSLQIRRPAADTGLRRAAPTSNRTAFVARDAELAVLRRAVQRAVEGVGGLVLLPGEPGVGKTRLAEEATREAVANGCAGYAGHCYERAGAPPYVAVIEMLEAALTETGDPVRFRDTVLRDAAPEIARLLPHLRLSLPDLPAPMDLPAEQARRLLFTGLIESLARLAAARPVVLTLDDLQWADEPTLALLERLAPELPRMPVLVIATYRSAELSGDVADLLADLHRRRLAEHLTVNRLPRDGSAALLRALADRPVSDDLVAGLHERTEGNPFFLEEVYRHLRELDRLDGPGTDSGTPEALRLVIRRRVERLSPLAGRLLGAAAVAGRVLPFDLLHDLSEVGRAEALDAVDEARRAVLLVDSGPNLMFSHELVRQALVTDMSGARRELAHRRAADAKERLYAEALAEHAAEIAHHLAAAGGQGCPTRLGRMQLLAGRRALDTSAFGDAVAHLAAAADLAGRWPAGERGELLLLLGDALQRTGRIDDAVVAWNGATDAYAEIDDVEAAGRVYLLASMALAWATRMEESVASYLQGLEVVGDRVTPARVRMLAAFAGMRGYADPNGVDALWAQALDLAEQIGDPTLIASVHGERCFGLQGCMRPAEGLESGRLAEPALDAAADHWALAQLMIFQEYNLIHVGRFAESAAIGERLEVLSRRLGHPMAIYSVNRAAGMRRWASTGSLTVLRDLGRSDYEGSMALGWPSWASHSCSFSALADHLAGDFESAERFALRAMELVQIPFFEGFTWGTRARLLIATGRVDEARAMLFDLAEHLPPGPGCYRWGQWAWLFATVECRLLLEEPDAAAALLPTVLAARGTGVRLTTYIEGRLLERVVGMAATAAGEWELAEESLRTAIAQADEIPHQLERWESRYWYARLLRRRGDPGVGALFAEAAKPESVDG